MSKESIAIAERILKEYGLEATTSLRDAIAKALEESWNQGYEDAKAEARLAKVKAHAEEDSHLHLQDLNQ